MAQNPRTSHQHHLHWVSVHVFLPNVPRLNLAVKSYEYVLYLCAPIGARASFIEIGTPFRLYIPQRKQQLVRSIHSGTSPI